MGEHSCRELSIEEIANKLPCQADAEFIAWDFEGEVRGKAWKSEAACGTSFPWRGRPSFVLCAPCARQFGLDW
jgi:hypothetical protein